MRTVRPAHFFRLALPLALVAGAAALPAQDATVTGQVRDVHTGEPLAGAIVELPEHRRRAVTGPQGEFQLRSVPEGRQHWVIRRLGYAEWEQHESVRDGERLVIRLLPDAVALEAIAVRSDRLERRRRSTTVSVRVIARDEILTTPAATTEQLVLQRAIPFRVSCEGTTAGSPGHTPCIYSRGAVVPANLCIDEAPATFGELVAYPREEIYAIETYQHGRTVRVYTNRFIEGERAIRHLGLGCSFMG